MFSKSFDGDRGRRPWTFEIESGCDEERGSNAVSCEDRAAGGGFDRDGQSTLVLSLVAGHGRATPLIWLTVWKEEIATRRNDYEDACLRRLAETMPAGCRVTILADRGFGDQKLFAFLAELGFG